MRNLADAIESFIIGELLRDQEDALMVQRNELAERLDCAPSQISYVLSTRFTPERGYLVESRRGSGGFVRIVRMESQQRLQQEPTAEHMVEHLVGQHIVTGREAALLKYMLSIIAVNEQKKKEVLRKAISLLNSTGRR